jgi:RNA-binding protein YhbY
MVVLRVIVVLVISSFLLLEIFGYRQFTKSCYKKNLSFGEMHVANRLLCSKSSEEISTDKENDSDFQIWSNPSYSEEQINKWYLDIDRALITVGSKGVAPGQINSLVDLLQQHVHIRVKVASDKLDSHVLSKEMADSELLVGKAELLQVRKRGFMFGTTEKTAAKNTALRNAKLKKVIESKDVTKIKCYNCDCVGHFSSDCPEPKKIESKASAKFSAKSKY